MNFVVVGGKVSLLIYFQRGVFYFVMTRASNKIVAWLILSMGLGFLNFLVR